jgi:signal transduction histidine kinase
VKNSIRILFLIFGLILSDFLHGNLFCQQLDKGLEFETMYEKGVESIGTDIAVARQCLEKLESYQKQFTSVQQAKTNYLRLRVIYADEKQFKALETRMFAAPDTLGHSEALIFSAVKYLEKSMPDKAIPLLMEVMDTLNSHSDRTVFCRINLCEAYREKQEYLKGVEMLNEIMSGKKTISDENRAFAYNRLAAIYNEWGNPKISYTDSVIKYSELCISLSQKINSISNLAFSQNELSFQYIRKKQYEKALELSIQAVKNFKEAGMNYSAMNALINQSSAYIGLKEYGLAFQAVSDATALCHIEENRNLFLRIYFQFARINQLTGNYKDAYDFLSITHNLQNEFFKDRINMQINEQSARYDLLIKEQKIREEKQKSEYYQKQKAFLIITVIVLCIAFIVGFFYLRLKRKEYLKQKLLEAVVETEENERKRIARDLHDGLGPVLSAINHYFQAYIDAKNADKEAIQTRLQQVISGAIDEVSRISHNISPHVLEKHGLNTALNNFIAPLTNSGRIKVNFTYGFSERFEQNKELSVYRCITELFNNTMKHAGATEITLDIINREKVIFLYYSDNGKGFDVNLAKTEGMGLYNIKNRVETFGGKLVLESSADKGIQVYIEFPLQ